MRLLSDLFLIGENLYRARKKLGYTQNDVAEYAGLSDRTYADIERGKVNMRIGTFVQICKVLHITPNDILVTDNYSILDDQEEIIKKIGECAPKEQATILRILSIYLDSL